MKVAVLISLLTIVGIVHFIMKDDPSTVPTTGSSLNEDILHEDQIEQADLINTQYLLEQDSISLAEASQPTSEPTY